MRTNPFRLTAMLMALVVFLGLGSLASAEDKPDPRDLVIEEASKIRSDNPDFKIQLKLVSKKDRVVVGDTVAFEFTSSQNAHVTILDIGSSGKVKVIFPNKWHKGNRVEKGKVYRIPGKDESYSFTVKGPTGVNFVKAIGTLKPFDWIPREAIVEAKEEMPFDEVKDAAKVVKDLAVELTKQDKKGWTETETNFTILAAGDKSPQTEEASPATLERDSKKFTAKLWTDKKEYQIGSAVTFYFFSEKDCYLNLIDFGTSGKVRVVFPNRAQKDNFVKGGEVLAIPASKEDEFRFRIKGPAGKERVKAVVTSYKVQLKGTYDFDKFVYPEWDESSETVEKEIDAQLGEMPDHVRSKTWTTFKVVP
jgi:hypothetical protein